MSNLIRFTQFALFAAVGLSFMTSTVQGETFQEAGKESHEISASSSSSISIKPEDLARRRV